MGCLTSSKSFDFDVDPDHSLDPGIFNGIFAIACEKPSVMHVEGRCAGCGCYFRFLSGRKWIFRQGFHGFTTTIDHGTTTSRPDEEPATGAISTSGRATSGSGLGAPPGFRMNFRAYIVTSERPVRECYLNTMPAGWDSKTASGRSSSGSGRSGTRPVPDIEVGQLEEAGKPVGFILDTRF